MLSLGQMEPKFNYFGIPAKLTLDILTVTHGGSSNMFWGHLSFSKDMTAGERRIELKILGTKQENIFILRHKNVCYFMLVYHIKS